MAKPGENKIKYIETSDFTSGLNTLDDPIDIDKGASPYMLNMDITKKGKLMCRNGYELVCTIPATIKPMRGIQTYYRTYDDNSAVDNHDDTNGAQTYTVPTTITETATTVDSYSESNVDSYLSCLSSFIQGQCFAVAADASLASVVLYLKNTGATTGNAVVSLYAMTGSYGTTGKPTGAALATSDPFDTSILTTSAQLITFNFTGVNQYRMLSATDYCLTLSFPSGTGTIQVGVDGSAPAHGGNAVNSINGGSTWTADATRDLAFYVYTYPDRKSFTPSAALRNRIFSIGVYVVAKGTGNWTLTLHDATNTVLGSLLIANTNLTNGQINYFKIPYTWTSGTLHFHLTSTVADGTVKTGITADMETLQPWKEIYRTSGEYLLLHCGDGNTYYITATNTTPTSIGTWGTDNGQPVRGTTFVNQALFSDGGLQNTAKRWNGSTYEYPGGVPRCNIFGVFQTYIFSNDLDNPSNVRFSVSSQDPGFPDTLANWPTINFIPITPGDGTDITALIPNADFLQTFKLDNMSGINFSFDPDYRLTSPQQQPIVNSQGGVWAPGSAQPIYGYTYYMSKKGFEQYGPTLEKVFANRPLPISLEIQPTFASINMGSTQFTSSTFFNSNYMCAVPLGAATVPNAVFVFNETVKRRFVKDNWTIYNNIPAAGFCLFRNSQKVDELYFISSYEPKVYKFNNTFSDDGFAYAKIWTSKTFKFGEHSGFHYIDIEGVMTLNEVIDVTVTTDGIQMKDQISKDNLITPALVGSYIGDSYVGGEYIGGGYTGASVPVYKFKKRVFLNSSTNEGYAMNFQLSSSSNGEGWGLNRYVLAYEQFAEDPTYARVV